MTKTMLQVNTTRNKANINKRMTTLLTVKINVLQLAWSCKNLTFTYIFDNLNHMPLFIYNIFKLQSR